MEKKINIALPNPPRGKWKIYCCERQNQLLSFKAIANGFAARLYLHKPGYREERAALPKRDCWWWRWDLHRSRLGGSACLAKDSSALPTQPSSAHFPKLNFWLLSLKNIFSERERERRSAVSEDVLPVSLRTRLWI